MQSIWTFVAAVISFSVTALTGIKMVPYLHRINFNQTIRESGPTWHKKKNGTPTMGGFLFIFGIIVAVLICIPGYFFTSGTSSSSMVMRTKITSGLLMACGFGLIGFLDDYIKVIKKRNLGLNVRQKLVLQFLVAAAYLLSLNLGGSGSVTLIPFVGGVNLGVWYWIIALFGIVGIVNAVNFTDGIDGLNASVTFFVAASFMMIAGVLRIIPAGIFAAAAAGAALDSWSGTCIRQKCSWATPVPCFSAGWCAPSGFH